MKGPIFIVGNSRSGTTMMMRIMNQHSEVHSINEPHFFGSLWSPADEDRVIEREEAKLLFLKLFTRQRAGFFEKVDKHKAKYKTEVDSLLSTWPNEKKLTRTNVYSHFLYYEATFNSKSIPCEKTPQNVFYIAEILDTFPDAHIIHMVRDPRGTMLSQKNKWKRRKLGAVFITKKEVFRLRVNYHPITMSRLWNAAVKAGMKYANHASFIEVRFKDLVSDPEHTLRKICAHLSIPYEEGMLQIPHAGSSLEADNTSELGIRQKKEQSWQEKGLTDVEIHECQTICHDYMKHYGFQTLEVHPSLIRVILSKVFFPIKLTAALLMNLNRMRSIADTIKRRMS
jgi:omega-hydroxy-beta-dihydromenaquinone-9 sulfotransferase